MLDSSNSRWKKWVTHDCYFCLTTSKIGIDVTDTWQLMNFHKLFPFPIMQRYNENEHRNVPIKAFAGNLSAQLLRKATEMEEAAAELRKRKYYDSFPSEDSETGDITTSESIEEINNDEGDGLAFLTNGGRLIEGCKVVNSFKDGNGGIHTLCKFPVIQTGKNMKKRSRVHACESCSKETAYFCYECKNAFCYCKKGSGHG